MLHYIREILCLKVVEENDEPLFVYHFVLKTAETGEEDDHDHRKCFWGETGGERILENQLQDIEEAVRERDDVHDCDLKVEIGLALVKSIDVKVFKLFL